MPDNVSSQQSGGSVDTLREELNALRAQMERLVKAADEKRHEVTADMAHKIAHELDRCRERAGHIKKAGQAGIDEVEEQVRQNPLASVLIAFGVGWVISCLFRHLR